MPTYQKRKEVVCPGCKTNLAVPNKDNRESFTFNCPKCSKLLKVTFHKLEDLEPDTDPPRADEAEEARTRMMQLQSRTLTPPSNAWPQTPGSLVYNSDIAKLHIGRNTCGRRPVMSQPLAQHHFPVDNSVSKIHFEINVKQRKDNTFFVSLTLHKQQVSFTTVDNLPLRYGDEIVLRDGSVIQAGHEIFRYTSKQI